MKNFFRHDSGRLVATLARRVGVQHLELVEDAVQSALLAALDAWAHEVPMDPGAWLYTAAHHRLMQEFRQRSLRHELLERAPGQASEVEAAEPVFAQELRDDLLRMLFVCCDQAMPWESRLVLALKTLCGFSTAEIALRLFASEANVHKRLQRARERLRRGPLDLATPPLETLRARLPSVHGVLYLLFNEGYLAAHPEETVRLDLCDEAIRLASLLAEHPVGSSPETFALLALMHFHAARLGARLDAMGGLLLLEEQDRSLWDAQQLRLGAQWLARSAGGEVFSRYHAEAGIAAEHSLSPSFEQTRWREIATLYSMLERIAPSPLHTLNRAVALAEAEGPAAGLAVLEALAPPAWLEGSYLWDAALGDLNRRAGHAAVARQHRDRALSSAPTEAVRALLRRRLRVP